MYDQNTVLLAAGITASATVGITLYAIYSKSEFTSYWQGLTGIFISYLAIGWSFFMSITFLTLMNFWIVNIPLFSSFIALGFAIMYSAYLVIDTQLILGKGKHNISLDNYILGSIFLYLDIIGLFLEILRILGKARKWFVWINTFFYIKSHKILKQMEVIRKGYKNISIHILIDAFILLRIPYPSQFEGLRCYLSDWWSYFLLFCRTDWKFMDCLKLLIYSVV